MTEPDAIRAQAEVATGYADARYDVEHGHPPRARADRSPGYQRGYALGRQQTLVVQRLRLLEQAPPEEYYVDLDSVRRLLEMSTVLVDLLDGFDLAVTAGGVDSRRSSREKASVSQTLQYLERMLRQAQALVGVEYDRLRNMPDVAGLDDEDYARLIADLRALGEVAGP